jgi:predicted peptidase
MLKFTPTLLVALAAGLLCSSGAHAQQPGKQTAAVLNRQITRTVRLDYLAYLPADYGKDKEKKWPLLLFLHGSGESGSDVEKVKVHGPPKLLAAGQQMPFIVISPQCPNAREGWDPEALRLLLDEASEKYTVDPDRVYLTGLSMGGYGTWALAAAFPERFAAAAPICGGGRPRSAGRLKGLPMWVFHGAKDATVPLSQSQEMVDALKAAGGDVRFTIYPEAGHDSWTETYNNPELFTWLLSHKRGAK